MADEVKIQEYDEQMDVRILFALGAQWIKLDDVIAWAKKAEFHDAVRVFVKLKNQKPNR